MKKLIFTSAIISILLILASCGGVKDSTKIENVSVIFSVPELSGRNARTIMPTNMEESDITKVTLYAEKYEGSTKKEYELSKSEWITLAAFEQENFTIAVGKYSFILNICANNGFSEAITQTCTLDDVIIDGSTKTISFDELKYANDYGYVLYNISWPKKDVIAKVEAALYQGTELKYSQALMRNGTDSGSTATATMRVNNGSYISKLMFYNNNDDTTPFNTITDVIKVNGYKTEYEISMALELLNIKYSVTFNPNGGRWKDGSTGNKTATRNAYDGFVSPAELEKQGWTFDGWLDEDGNSIDELVTPGSEEAARDWTVYANWVKKASGNITLDNGALTITAVASSATTGTLLDNGVLYQNDTITFTAKDNAGNDVTDDVTFDAKLLYKGQDIGNDYYTLTSDGKTLKINGLTKEVPSRYCYQLYVTANWLTNENFTNVYSSQTFDVRVESGLSTPVTQVALYTYDSGSYKYYLKDSNKLGEALGEQTLSANMKKSAFDASGYFYVAYKDNYGSDGVTIYSNNPLFESNGELRGVQLPLEDAQGTSYSDKYQDFAIDLTTNILYGCAVNMTSLYLYKYPNFITSASTEDCIAYDYINVSDGYFYPSQIAINDSTLYVFGYWTDNEQKNATWRVMVYDIPESGSFGDVKYTCDLDSKLIEKDSKLSYAKIIVNNGSVSPSPYGDMYAMDGALYLVLKPFTAWTVSNPNIYSGAIVKWIPGESEVTVRGLYSEKTVAQESITQMYLNYVEGDPQTVYATSERKTLKTMLADSTSFNTEEYSYGRVDGYKFFPNVYAMSAKSSLLDNKGFVGPAKIIGIKPKKLVIADDGYAFYTDNDMLYYKNVNRVVTIDLEDFTIKSIQSTKATFDSELTDYFKSGSSIDKIRSGGTYYDYGATVYYYDSSSREESGTIGFGSNFYLAVKNGDNQ